MSRLSHGLSGVAGEYHVCAELSRRGFIATLTLKNTEGIDILASRPGSGKAISIQVKTQQSEKSQWVLKEKNERHHASDFFYVLVRLGKVGERPAFHIVPSKALACEIARGHKAWLAGQKKDGSPRKDSTMRGFQDRDNIYLEAWDILG